MTELWARGNNIWRQLEFTPTSSNATGVSKSWSERERNGRDGEEGRDGHDVDEEDDEREPWNLDVYGKVLEAEEGMEWVRSDGFGSLGML